MEIDVLDLGLSTININKIEDYNRRRKAKNIYNNDNIEIDKVVKTKSGNLNMYDIDASVSGNYGVYKTWLKIINEDLESYSCTCADYKNGNLCKHILATCEEILDPHRASTEKGRDKYLEKQRKEAEERLRIWNEYQERLRKEQEYQERYSEGLSLISTYRYDDEYSFGSSNNNDRLDIEKIYNEALEIKNKEKQNVLPKSLKIEIKANISSSSQLDLSFKIGAEKMYLLKDLVSFCEAFETGEFLDFGVHLKFYAKRENFKDEYLELLEYILKYAKMIKYQRTIAKESFYYSHYLVSSKVISLYQDQIDEFFEISKDMYMWVENDRKSKCYCKNSQDKFNIVLSVNKGKDEISLKSNLSNASYVISSTKIYVFKNGQVYIFDLKKNKDLHLLLDSFSDSSEISIPKEKIDEFTEYVWPKIKKYTDYDQLIDKENKDFGKLSSKMYLDLDKNDNITLTLKFCYNDNEFNALDDKDLTNMSRNFEDEKGVLLRLFKDGFEIDTKNNCLVLKNEEDIYDFLVEKIEGYMADYEVLATEKLTNRKVRRPKVSSIGVRLNNGLLDIDMSKIDIDADEIKNVLKQYNIKKKYYKLKNGDFLNLEKSEELDLLNDMSNSLDIDFAKIKDGKIKLPVNRSLYLERLLNTNPNLTVSKNDSYNQLINNIGNKNFSESITIPKNIESKLRSYQVTGYKWLKVLEQYGFGGILADDMGLGKTLQIISIISSYIQNENHLPSIVVCPSSLALNWKAEVEKWCRDINVVIVSGTASVREEIINNYEKYDLIITSYDLLKRDVEKYEGKHFKYIIADEAQYIKNFSTQNATALKSLEGETKFALTGTPIENSVSELWSIFDFCMPGYLYNYNKFKKRFESPIVKDEDKEALKKLKMMIEPFILRRLKKDVLTELPDKNITVMTNKMTTEQEKLYLSYLSQIKTEVSNELSENGFEKSKFKILMLLTRLRQVCCHPSLFIENYKGESGKLNQCLDLIKGAIDSGHKILLFSQYTTMFEIIEEELKKRNIQYFKLTGKTSVDKRVELVNEFNQNDNIKIFLISLKAGGTGLNLTGADVVIHYDPWWNVSSENQATDRAYRIGQKNSVQVYKLITDNSIEEKINKLQEKKAKLSENVLSTGETFINMLSKEEVLALFE